MINIFNLFLFLCVLWASLSYATGSFTIFFLIFGVFISFFISIISWKLKIITKNFNFLFLNLGFYKHFLLIFFTSFFKTFLFLIKYSIKNNEEGLLHQIQLKKILNKSDLRLFVATVSFIPGISYIRTNKDNILIFATNKEIFDAASLSRIYHGINDINDDSLI